MTRMIRRLRSRRRAPQAATPPATPVVTRAEQAECTCPEACERDHEWD